MSKDEVKKLYKSIDKSKYSHLIICINRLNSNFIIRLVEKEEKLFDVINEIDSSGLYKTVYMCKIDKHALSNLKEFDIIQDEDVNKASKDALDFATKMHDGQYRKDGTEYITHPIRVADYLQDFDEEDINETLLASAYLHDTLEDTDITHYDLVGKFGSQVASIVVELTNDEELKTSLGKTKYLEIKMENMTNEALIIKLCDRLDNVSDLKDRDKSFRNRYVKETINIIDYLLNNRELSDIHIKIIKKIIEYLEMCKNEEEINEKINSVNSKVKLLCKTNVE